MLEQVGGLSADKKPVLTVQPDYVLKPLIMDHRGIREIHFYEAVFHNMRPQPQPESAGTLAAATKSWSSSTATTRWLDWWDTLAMATAILLQDKVILDTEEELYRARKRLKRELELLRRLGQFLPQYYGVVGQTTTAELTSEAHLLLHNVVSNFTAPCIMDLKMGQCTFVSMSCWVVAKLC